MSNRVDRSATITPIHVEDRGDFELIKKNKISIESHWNRDDCVILKLPDRNLTILVSDLITAIKACSRGY